MHSRRRGSLAGTILLAAFAFASVSVSAARDLRWDAIDVRARLDAEGALHVVETQTMVFSGDWNGGERTFRLFPGQSVTLESVTRIDPEGGRHPLNRGGLSAVDEWDWAEENVLRWRSRLPGDPEFSETTLVYELAYTLRDVLVRQSGGYLLDHNFGLPAATFPIRKLTVTLELDPVWKPAGAFPGRYEGGPLSAGSNFTVSVPLAYTGAGAPAAGPAFASPGLRRGLLGALVAAIVFAYVRWRRRDQTLGRFAPLTPASEIGTEWLERNLLVLAPEEAGALWDEKVGPPEVAAVLARLSAEKKIETEVEGKKLVMRLLVPAAQFDDYERELIQGLFFGGRKETDTDAIKAHYRSRGFNPASRIEPGLKKKLQALPDFGDAAPKPSRWPALLLALAGVACFVFAVLQGRTEPGTVIGAAIVTGVIYLLGLIGAWTFQNRIRSIDPWSLSFLWAPALLVWMAWYGVQQAAPYAVLVVTGTFLLRLAAVWSLFNVVCTRNGPKRLARRKQLAAARAYFVEELKKPEPRLRDAWFPYVVAFGLTSEADRWFRAHGAAAAAGTTAWSGSRSSGSSSSSSSSSSSGGWSGGGGAFGGAGASGTWAVAAGALAAGVSAPSSSSSGGGGGGGGSSGGGGGGGW